MNQNSTNILNCSARKPWVDAGKGMSMLLVMLFHAEMYFPSTEIIYSEVLGYFHMPFFFFLSGYVYSSCLADFSFRRKAKQIVRSILWTYFIFTSIIVFPKSMLNGTPLSEGIMAIFMGYASWFVIVLGVSQLFYALLFSVKGSIKPVPCFMIVSVVAGYLLKSIHPEKLPYLVSDALIVNFFVGLGILYRAYEEKIHSLIKVKWSWCILFFVAYLSLFLVDKNYIHTPIYIYDNDSPYTNLPLYLLYAMLGIAMMIYFVKLVHLPQVVHYIGRNSLVFYYLNGGVIHTTVYVLGLWGMSSSPLWHCYLPVLILACLAAAIITCIVKFIRRYCPIIVGDKEAFNRVSQRLRLGITW